MVPDRQEAYKKTLLKQLYFKRELSCADLSVLTGKSLPHTTRALYELVESGLVLESGYAMSTGGRRPQMYSIKPDFMYILAVAMDQFVTSIGIMDMHNNMIGEEHLVQLDLSAHPKAITILGEELKAFIDRSSIPKEQFAGIGIGMPGFVDVKKGINYSFFNTDFSSINKYLQAQTGLPVIIDNDSSLVALAEWKLGAARGKQNALVINIG